MNTGGHELRFVDGAPDITHLPCDKLVTGEGAEYMRRYYTRHPHGQQARFHHIVASDPGRDMHDHPWDFISTLLAGTYTEHTPGGAVEYHAPCVIVRKAEQLHRLELTDGPVWSYVVLGRRRRQWGFMTADGWVRYDLSAEVGRIAGCSPGAPPGTGHARRRRRPGGRQW